MTKRVSCCAWLQRRQQWNDIGVGSPAPSSMARCNRSDCRLCALEMGTRGETVETLPADDSSGLGGKTDSTFRRNWQALLLRHGSGFQDWGLFQHVSRVATCKIRFLVVPGVLFSWREAAFKPLKGLPDHNACRPQRRPKKRGSLPVERVRMYHSFRCSSKYSRVRGL